MSRFLTPGRYHRAVHFRELLVNPNVKGAAGECRNNELWTFFRQWLRKPLSTAAVSPSSRFLARRIVAALPPGTTRVIELGAGTGMFTRAMLQHGIGLDDLLAIEFNPELHAFLTRNFPGLEVIQADARELTKVEAVGRFLERGPVQAMVSGLGLLSMTRETQRSILQGVFSLMPPDGVLVQFTYGPVAPVAAEVMQELGLKAVRRSFTLLNVPPASVYTFTRTH
jgi:phosphatidylethanolamine/phosphatidyl-N-methylethanolamine N-methyltransferase